MLRFSTSLLLLLITLAPSLYASTGDVERLTQDFQRMLDWFPGEYDNEEQAKADVAAGLGEGQSHEHIHHLFVPVTANNIGEHAFFIKQYMDGDYENVYRQRLYTLENDSTSQSVKLTIYSFLDEKKYRYTDKDTSIIKNITKEELKTIPGCEVYWTFADGYFTGRMIDKACGFFSKRSNKMIYISDTLKLTDKEIWIADKAVDDKGNYVFGNKDGIPHKNTKLKSIP